MPSRKKKSLTINQRQTVGALLVDILAGNVRDETRLKLHELDRAKIPEPYNHLVSHTRGSGTDGRELARDLLEELRFICVELQGK